MARTQVQSELIATNAISGTIIADNAITATHIATNSISGTLVQDSGIVTSMIAANNVTAAKIVSDGVEHRHLHSNVISGLSTVTAASGDFLLIGDTSDSDNLKKALVSDIGVSGISSSADATAITIDSNEKVGIGESSPTHHLHVNAGTTNVVAVFESSDAEATIRIKDSVGTAAIKCRNDFRFNTSESTELMRINSSGRVMIGTTTEGRANEGADMFTIGDDGSDNSGMTMRSGTSGYGSLYFSDATSGTGEYAGYIQYAHNTDQMLIATNSTTKLTIHSSGCVGVGSTTDRSIGTNIGTFVVNGSAGGGLWLSTGDASSTTSKIYSITNGSVGELIINSGSGVGGGSIKFTMNADATPTAAQTKMYIASNGRMYLGNIGGGTGALNIMGEVGQSYDAIQFFHNSSTAVGYIRTASSSTTYSTSSDYRLKENVEYNWDATTRLKQLKPVRFNFKTEKDTTLDGFLAHEVSSIVPEAITGEKDGKEMQGIDQSKLVPLLVKTIQELEARITTLEG